MHLREPRLPARPGPGRHHLQHEPQGRTASLWPVLTFPQLRMAAPRISGGDC
jgi:hypothetical protein